MERIAKKYLDMAYQLGKAAYTLNRKRVAAWDMHLMKIIEKAAKPIESGFAAQLCRAWARGWDAKCSEVIRVEFFLGEQSAEKRKASA